MAFPRLRVKGVAELAVLECAFGTSDHISPLPHPATHIMLPLGGRAGERGGAALKFALSRISKETLRVDARKRSNE
jgi:hypothetical protein